MGKAKKQAGPGRPKREGDGPIALIIRLPPALHERVVAAAEVSRRSMNAVVLECIAMQIDRVEQDVSIIEVSNRVEALEEKISDLRERVRYLEGTGE